MNDLTPADGTRDQAPDQAPDQERLLVILSYGLYLVSVAGGLPLLVGVIIAFVRRPHARGTIYESHYRNLILVFFVMLLFAATVLATGLAGVMALLFGVFAGAFVWQFPMALMLVPVAALISLALGLWFLWRVIGGLIRVLDEKPY